MSSNKSNSRSAESKISTQQAELVEALNLHIPKPTENNGFARGLQVQKVLASCTLEFNTMFAVKFKGCSKPEIISLQEMRSKASKHLLAYYLLHTGRN